MAKVQTKRTEDLPATRGMLFQVRDELKKEIRGANLKIESLDHKVDALGAELRSEIQNLGASLHRMELRIEEQHANNKIVLDAFKGMADWKNHIESEQAEMKSILKSLARNKKLLNQ